MSIIYTDPGSMNRQVDIWDQPLVSLASASFAAGAPVLQIVGVQANTASPSATQLGQQTAWPQLDKSRVSLNTHNITIRYKAGLKSRMYLIYHDPDNGDRKFQIDRIVDPDEQKVETHHLGF